MHKKLVILELYSDHFLAQGVLNKDPTVRLYRAKAPRKYTITQNNKTFGRCGKFLSVNTPNVHGGFINILC
jgi:hypothetical protein